MRIIAGTFRGRRLQTPRDLTIRPMTDRVRQAVFDILSSRMPFNDCEVLDLYSGSGSLGLEALSRGARRVTFVDSSRVSLDLLRRNIEHLGCADRCVVHQADVGWYLEHVRCSFDLVLADPPYRLPTLGELPAVIGRSGAVRPGGFIVLEHSTATPVTDMPDGYEVIRRDFGQTRVLILRLTVPASHPYLQGGSPS